MFEASLQVFALAHLATTAEQVHTALRALYHINVLDEVVLVVASF